MSNLTSILAALQNGVVGINNLTKQLASTFPGATAVSTVSPSSVGAITFTSSETKGFFTVTSSSGASYKIALY